MRKSSTLIGLTLVALGAGARAEETAPAAPPPPAPPAAAVVIDASPAAPAPVVTIAVPNTTQAEPRSRRLKVGLSFLPMGLGKFTTPIGGMPIEGDASFAYGFGLMASYRVIAGLELGIAPQIIYNVNYKEYPAEIAAPAAAKETDLMARVAYTFPIVETIGLYVEVLPGYSSISQPGTSAAKGFVLGLGGGVEMSVTDRIFANLGGGYQLGYQSVSVSGTKLDDRAKYVRITLGGGFRF